MSGNATSFVNADLCRDLAVMHFSVKKVSSMSLDCKLCNGLYHGRPATRVVDANLRRDLAVMHFGLRVKTAEEGFPSYQYQLQGKGDETIDMAWHALQHGTMAS